MSSGTPAGRCLRGQPGNSSCQSSRHTCKTTAQLIVCSCPVCRARRHSCTACVRRWRRNGASRAHARLLPHPCRLQAGWVTHRRNLASGSLLSSLGGSWWPQEACAADRRRCRGTRVPARRAPPGEAARPACDTPMMLRWRCRLLLAVPGPASCALMVPKEAQTWRDCCPQRLWSCPVHRWCSECRLGLLRAPQQSAACPHR